MEIPMLKDKTLLKSRSETSYRMYQNKYLTRKPFIGFSEVSDSAMANISYHLKYLTNLKTLSLNFTRCNTLIKSFKHLRTLETLKLDFSFSKRVLSTDLIKLSESLKYLPFLRVISLDFSHCENITGRSITNLAKCLTTLHYIQALIPSFMKFKKIKINIMLNKNCYNMIT